MDSGKTIGWTGQIEWPPPPAPEHGRHHKLSTDEARIRTPQEPSTQEPPPHWKTEPHAQETGTDPFIDTMPVGGLHKFDLGMVPASVTPPRSWHRAAWFTVVSSAAALCGLLFAASAISDHPSTSLPRAMDLPGMPNARMPNDGVFPELTFPNPTPPNPTPPNEDHSNGVFPHRGEDLAVDPTLTRPPVTDTPRDDDSPPSPTTLPVRPDTGTPGTDPTIGSPPDTGPRPLAADNLAEPEQPPFVLLGENHLRSLFGFTISALTGETATPQTAAPQTATGPNGPPRIPTTPDEGPGSSTVQAPSANPDQPADSEGFIARYPE